MREFDYCLRSAFIRCAQTMLKQQGKHRTVSSDAMFG